jgi:hypothetical protein
MNPRPRISQAVLAAIAASGLLLSHTGPAGAQSDASESEHKTVRSSGGRPADRGEAPLRSRSGFVESDVPSVERLSRNGKSDSRTAAVLLEEAWIYDAGVELFDDFDGDGYFTYLRITFDADSIYSEHWVYARLFLTLDGITWDEYHITNDFLIEGSSDFDDYEVETELVAGFQPGLYDALIELYDADLGHFLGEFGPVQSSAFSLLPLEDIDNDTPQPVVVVTSEHGGGGASGVLTLIGLLAGGLVAARRRGSTRQSRNTCSAVV